MRTVKFAENDILKNSESALVRQLQSVGFLSDLPQISTNSICCSGKTISTDLSFDNDAVHQSKMFDCGLIGLSKDKKEVVFSPIKSERDIALFGAGRKYQTIVSFENDKPLI